jgi:broad-specificity NMP kinase
MTKQQRLEQYYSVFSVPTLQKSKEYYLAEIEDIMESHSLRDKKAVVDNMTSRLTAIQSVIESKLRNA